MADTGSGIVRGMKAIPIRFENSLRIFGREMIRCPQGKKKLVCGAEVYSEEDNKALVRKTTNLHPMTHYAHARGEGLHANVLLGV